MMDNLKKEFPVGSVEAEMERIELSPPNGYGFHSSLGILILLHIGFFQLGISWIYQHHIRWQQDLKHHSGTSIEADSLYHDYSELPLPANHFPSSTFLSMSTLRFIQRGIRKTLKLELIKFTIPCLFALTFSCCLSLLSLLLFEPLGILSWQARRYKWGIDLIALVCLVYFILPLSFVVILSSSSNSTNLFVRPFFTLLVAISTIFWTIVLPFQLAHSYLDLSYHALRLPDLISRLGLCGVVVVSILSGFGSVEFPYRRLSALVVPVFPEQISSVRSDLQHTEKRTRDKELQLKQLSWQPNKNGGELQLNNDNEDHYLEQVGLQIRHSKLSAGINLMDSLNSARHEIIRQLEDEIEVMKLLRHELSSELKELELSRTQALQSTTLYGRINNMLGWIMVIVCIYRVVTSLFNVSYKRVSTVDPVTFLLRVWFFKQQIPSHLVLSIPYISFLLMGITILLTIRGVLMQVTSVFQVCRRPGLSAGITVLLSEFLALYFAAYTLLLRAYLPENCRAIVASTLGDSVNFSALQLLSDAIFAVSALISLILLSSSHIWRKHKLTYKTF